MNEGKIIWSVVTGFLVLILLLMSIYTIDAGQQGVLLTFGKASEDVKYEGIHIKIPLFQKIVKYETRNIKLEVASESTSMDLQSVNTVTATNYRLFSGSTTTVYRTLGKDYVDRVIDPTIQETVRAVMANYKAEELITKRSQVREDIKETLRTRLKVNNIELLDFNIVNYAFSDEFNAAIEAKVTAQQLKLKAEMDLERIIVEKEQAITRAQAEAESLRLQKTIVTDQLIELRKVENQRLAIEAWNGVLPTVTGGAIPLINVGG